MRNLSLFLAMLGMVFSACKKESEPVDFAEVVWTAETIQQYRDQLLQLDTFHGDLFLWIDAGLDLSPFNEIRVITGNLEFNNTEIVTDFGFSNLEEVGALTLNFNQVAEEINFPSLRIAEKILIWHHKKLTRISLPALELSKNIAFYDNERLERIEMPNLLDFFSMGVLRNPSFKTLSCCNQLSDTPIWNDHYKGVSLDFSIVQCPETLFKDSPIPLHLRVKVEEDFGNDFTWLSNLELNSAEAGYSLLELDSSIPYSELCFLKELVNLDDPENVHLTDGGDLGPNRSILELIEECD